MSFSQFPLRIHQKLCHLGSSQRSPTPRLPIAGLNLREPLRFAAGWGWREALGEDQGLCLFTIAQALGRTSGGAEGRERRKEDKDGEAGKWQITPWLLWEVVDPLCSCPKVHLMNF